MLRVLHSQRLDQLRSKANLSVERSCLLRGVMDERGVLEYGEVYLRRSDNGTVIVGDVIVVKSPALHPGRRPALARG